MKNLIMKYLFFFILSLISSNISAQHFNQVGYASKAKKFIFLDKTQENKSFTVQDIANVEVLKGYTSEANYWEYSGTSVCTLDASNLTKEGVYTAKIGDLSITFKIDNKVNNEVGKALLKSFYHARASVPICEEFAGEYARYAGHPDNVVYIHESAASSERPAGTTIASPGGWYDAGDYNKYIVNSGITTFLLLNTYEVFNQELANLNVNIPESNNAVSDILDEAIVNLNWMLTMQDQYDGGVYHKLSSKKFCSMIPPSMDEDKRYVVQKSTAATLDFAAVCAKASRILKLHNSNYPNLSKQCLNAAKIAYKWALENPNKLYEQPDDISTGQYDDSDLSDEWFWASMELYLTTNESQYSKKLNINNQEFKVPEWRRVNMLGIYSALNASTNLPNNFFSSTLQNEVTKIANNKVKKYEASAYKIPITKFPWGSNAEVANDGVLLLIAYQQTQNAKYLEVAEACANYILGANPLGMSFITGFGFKYPKHLHDRRNASNGIEEPIPGYMAGGPTKSVLSDCGKENYNHEYPALCYVDRECSFSTNEIAINWQSSATSLFLGLDAIRNAKTQVVKVENRPNIIFFIADDMTRDMFNFLPEGKDKNLTPSLDKLSNEGIVMLGQHVASTVCTPSRYNSLSGKYASRANNPHMLKSIKKNKGQRVVEWNTHIVPGENNLAQMLKNAGYFTGAVGKNHVIEVENHQNVKLTDRFKNPQTRKKQLNNYKETIKAYKASGFEFADGIYYENPDFNGPRELAVHNLDWTTEAALNFIDQSSQKENPFFLYFATTLPHGPIKADRAWSADRTITPLGKLDKAPSVLPHKSSIPKRLKNAGKSVNDKKCNILWMDDALSALIQKLEETGLAENTIIIFFNDHGQYAKGTIYQGAVQNPSVIWKKGGFKAGKTSEAFISNVDFTPTILDWAGVSASAELFDGKSFAPVLNGEPANTNRALYFEIGYSRGVRKGNYKYVALRYPEWIKNISSTERVEILEAYNKKLAIRGKAPNNTDPNAAFGHVQIIPGGGDAEFPATQRYPFYSDADQLYNLNTDPGEQTNLANHPEYQEVLKDMKSELSKFIKTIPGSFGEFK